MGSVYLLGRAGQRSCKPYNLQFPQSGPLGSPLNTGMRQEPQWKPIFPAANLLEGQEKLNNFHLHPWT